MSVKFQSDTVNITSNLVASRLKVTWRQDVLPLVNRGSEAKVGLIVALPRQHLWNINMIILTIYRRIHDDVINWKHFPRYWPFVRGIHQSPVNPTNKGQWRGALMFSLICTRRNCWVNIRDAGRFRRHRAHYDVAVMIDIKNREINAWPGHESVSPRKLRENSSVSKT